MDSSHLYDIHFVLESVIDSVSVQMGTMKNVFDRCGL
jgi:hypothetical protein